MNDHLKADTVLASHSSDDSRLRAAFSLEMDGSESLHSLSQAHPSDTKLTLGAAV